MDRWMKAAGYAGLTAAVLWWMDPAGREWSSVLADAAMMVIPFRLLIAVEDRFGCGLCRLWS